MSAAAKRTTAERVGLRVRRLLYPGRFHLRPRHWFTVYRPTRMSLPAWLLYEAGFHLWRHTAGRGARLQRPIFVIGCPRSGTWITVNLFAHHPQLVNLSEAHDIWDPQHYRSFEADHMRTAADATPAEAARLHARFEHYRRRSGRERFLNKNPRNSVRPDYIRAIFPDAVFVHVIRDGRAVAASMLEWVKKRRRAQRMDMPFCHPPNWRELVRVDKAEQVALQWSAIVRHVMSKKGELGPAYHEFRYEELCEDPRGVLAAAWRFAGLRVDEEILAQLPPKLESQNFKWKQQLSLQQIETVNRVAGRLLEELGYPF